MNWDVDPIYGCWKWLGTKDKNGYAIKWQGKQCLRMHRVIWEQHHGPIPPDREIEHLCRRRDCVRPSHKAVVTRSQNLKLRSWKHRIRLRACPNGHDMAGCIVTPEGGRICRECNKGPT